jgi:hypothetical protein
VLKILKLFAADPDSGAAAFLTLDSGSGMEKVRIQDKYLFRIRNNGYFTKNIYFL